MNLIIKLPKIILALLFACIAVSTAQAAWTVDITSQNQVEPAIFGYDPEATDGEFDPAFEVLTTNPIQGKVMFSLDYIYAKKIKKDDLSWTLSVTVPSDGIEILWNSSLVPENIKLSLTKDTTVVDMKEQSSLILQSGAPVYTITAEVQEAPALTTIDVTPSHVNLEESETKIFLAKGYDQDVKEMTGLTFTWSSSNTTVGTIDSSSGEFTSLKAGKTTVSATSGEVTGTAQITVTAAIPVLTEIMLTPSETSVEEGKTQQFTATSYDQKGNEISEIEIEWSVENESVGTVNSETGLFRAINCGDTKIMATSGAISGNATVTVTSTPATQSQVTLSLPDLELKKFQSGIMPLKVENITDGEGILATVTWDSKIIRVESINVNESVFGNLSLACNLTENSATIQVIDPGKFNATSPTPFADIVYKAMGKKNGYTDLTICDASWSSSFNKYECCCDSGSVTITGIKGDFNNNNEIDIGDSSKVAYMVAGKVDVDSEADFNGQKGVDTGDAALIAWYLIGKIPTL